MYEVSKLCDTACGEYNANYVLWFGGQNLEYKCTEIENSWCVFLYM